MKDIFSFLIFFIYILYRSSLKSKIEDALKNYKNRFVGGLTEFPTEKLMRWSIRQSYVNLLMFFLMVLKEIGYDLYLLVSKQQSFQGAMQERWDFISFILIAFLFLSFRMEVRLDRLRKTISWKSIIIGSRFLREFFL